MKAKQGLDSVSSPSAEDLVGRRATLVAAIWLCVLVAALIFVIQQCSRAKPFYSDMMALLPETTHQPAVQALTEQLTDSFQQRLLILLRANSDTESVSQVAALREQLLALPGIRSSAAASQWLPPLKTSYQPFIRGLLTDASRRRLAEQSPENLASLQLQTLMSPLSPPRLYSFEEDPFGLGNEWLMGLQGYQAFDLYQGLPTVVAPGGERWFLIAAELTESPFELGLQQRLLALIDAHRQQQPDTLLLASGMVFHAAAGAAQAKQEMSTVGLGSLLGIVLLIFAVLRSAYPIVFVVLVLGCGCLFALASSLLIFGQIHLLTLVFGSTLLGVSVDYVFHFMIKARRYATSSLALQKIRRALMVGALTSIGAYLSQCLAPFPGLQQMAVFSASGLLGAWLTVLCLGHFYQTRPLDEETLRLNDRRIHQLLRPVYARGLTLPLRIIMVLLVVPAGLLIMHFGSNDNIAHLNTSGPELLEQEQQVQALMAYPSSHRFFLVQASSEQQLLQRLELLRDRLVGQPFELQTHSLVSFIPSLERQRDNLRLQQQRVYGSAAALEQLCEELQMDCRKIQRSLMAPTKLLTPDLLRASLLNSSMAGDVLPPVYYSEGQYFSLLMYTEVHPETVVAGKAWQHTVASGLEGVSWVDQAQQMSAILKHYRQQVGLILAVTLLVLALIMWLRYRGRAWRLLLPLYLSLSLALACAAVSGGITVFHLAALLLVLGIGIDMGVFYLEVGLAPDAWLAATLASMTSLLAFGLLSLSQVPVLHQFGVIVLSGILCCWLLTPLFFTLESKDSL